MATFNEVKGHNEANIRKILEMSIYMKPVEDGDVEITQVYDADGVIVPEGYIPIGYTTKDDGATWPRDQEISETTSYGESEPTRRDGIRDVRGLTFTAQESKRETLEIYHGVDLSGVTTDADGNFYFDAPSRPATRPYRVLAIGKDGDADDAIYVARWLPKADVTEQAEQAWTEADELRYPITLNGRTDRQFGTSFREIWGGPGLDHEAMNMPSPSGA